MKKPRVTFVIPVYNGEQWVSRSLQSCLDQTFTDIEVIVVDDGSTDDTLKVLQSFSADSRVRILQHSNGENRGVSFSRRLGVDNAQGEFIAFLDSDDYCLPARAEEQLKCFERYPEAVLVHSQISRIFTGAAAESYQDVFNQIHGSRLYTLYEEDDFLRKHRICISSVMIRKSVAEQIPFAYEQAYQSEDWAFMILASEFGPFYYLEKPLVEYNMHPDNWTMGAHGNDAIAILVYIELMCKLLPRLQSEKLMDLNLQQLSNALISLSQLDWPKNAPEERRKLLWQMLALKDSSGSTEMMIKMQKLRSQLKSKNSGLEFRIADKLFQLRKKLGF